MGFEEATLREMTSWRVGLGCLGGLVGAVLGGAAGSFAMYALAGLVTSNREQQAYLVVVIIPAVAVLGAVTVAATLALLPGRMPALLPVAAAGWLSLTLVGALGARWHHRGQPARVTVRNETNLRFENLFVGGDFRRSSRIGELGPGETSRALPIDLKTPDTFNALEGRAGTGYVRHRVSDAETASLGDGDLEWVVRGSDGALEYELRRRP
jgi:hypothetical protein